MHLNKIILSILLISPLLSFADFMEVSQKAKDERTIDKKWSMNLGADYRQIETGLPEFDGVHSNIEDGDAVEIWGVDLGVTRKLLNIGRFEIEARLSASYAKQTKNVRGLATEEYDDIDFSSERVDYQLASGRVNLNVGYTFLGKLVSIRPFVEFGTGMGNSTVEKEYIFEGIEADESDYESYDYKVKDSFLFTELVLGVSFIAKEGFYSYLKASQVASSITEREFSGSSTSGTTVTAINKDDEENISTTHSVFSIGVGYAF